MFQGRRSCVISDLSRLRKLREILVIISCDRVDVIGSGLFFSLLSEISVQQTYYRLANSVLLKFQNFLKLVKTASKYIQNRTGREDQGAYARNSVKVVFFFHCYTRCHKIQTTTALKELEAYLHLWAKSPITRKTRSRIYNSAPCVLLNERVSSGALQLLILN